MAYSSPYMLVFIFLACFVFAFSDNLVAPGDSEKVKLNLYYESLCPYCQKFITEDLVKVIDSDLLTITDLKLVPFGNAEVLDNNTITCQHGEEKCKLNAVQACAISTWPDTLLHLSFITCVEETTKDWKSCVPDPTSLKAINDCYSGDLSKKLILEYANQTLSLEPKHEYVPWVTLNGEPLYENYGDFVPLVCKAYKGKEALPEICDSSSLSRKKSKLQVSFVEDSKNY
ncbi:unnamed protein product [Microthlaspi erraticum]|uniref:Saposin A-type domain-containing protein n=1 Tax=Microthlaspi erraticum TaxID=1685480 RepID=A0A6D2IS81_9BRAS|nr:unnamed protein product [Microthlaspi erraticum]